MQTDSIDQKPIAVCACSAPNWKRDVVRPRVLEAVAAGAITIIVLGVTAIVFHFPTGVVPLLIGICTGVIGSLAHHWDKKRRHFFELHQRSIHIFSQHLTVLLDGEVIQTMTHDSEIGSIKESERLSWLSGTRIDVYAAENEDAIIDFDATISNLDQLLLFLNPRVGDPPLVS